MVDADGLRQANQRFYDQLWSRAGLLAPQRFNTWAMVERLVGASARCLEVAPGLRPRLPLQQTYYVDISPPALSALSRAGARALRGSVEALPFEDRCFDVVAALDVVEHVADDRGALAELRRVLRDGGRLLMSVPLHRANWTPFDEVVGHCRRYDPPELLERLRVAGLRIEQCAVYGMKPKSTPLVEYGMRQLQRRPRFAMWWYNRVFMPLALRRQPPLDFMPALPDDPGVDEVILLCAPVPCAA